MLSKLNSTPKKNKKWKILKRGVFTIVVLTLFVFYLPKTGFTLKGCKQIFSSNSEKFKYKPMKPISIQDTFKLINSLDHYISKANQLIGINGFLLISKEEEVQFKKVYNHSSTPENSILNEHSIFKIGSISKQFIAASILYLEQNDKLHITDKMCKYLKNCPPDKQEIKIIHLLNHTSGLIVQAFGSLRTAFYILYHTYFNSKELQKLIDEIINPILKKSLIHKPGEKYLYSNAAYTLLAKIIENVSEKNHDHFIIENLLSPLEMKSIGSLSKSNFLLEPVPDLETKNLFPILYKKPFNFKAFNQSMLGLKPLLHGSGDIYTTAYELVKWNHALYEKKQILNKIQLEKMTQSYKNEYGLGIVITSTKQSKSKVYWHNGLILNSFSINFYFPKQKLSVIFLSNSFSRKKSSDIFHSNLINLLLEKEYNMLSSLKNANESSAKK